MTSDIGNDLCKGLAPALAQVPVFSSTTAWLILALAGLTEIGWAVGLKYSDGFSKLWPSVFTVSLMVVSMLLLAQAARVLPIGTAYAVWTGIGAVGAGVLGMVLFKEPHTAARVACIALIIAGIVGLKFTSVPGISTSASSTPDR